MPDKLMDSAPAFSVFDIQLQLEIFISSQEESSAIANQN
jgi:hypothetical protein